MGFERSLGGWSTQTGARAADVYHSLQGLFCQGVRGTFDCWLAVQGLSPDLAHEMVDVYRAHRPEIELFPGLRETLQGLQPAARLGLLSDGYLKVQQAKLDALSVRQLFSAVLLTDELGRDFWTLEGISMRAFMTPLMLALYDAGYEMHMVTSPGPVLLELSRDPAWTAHPIPLPRGISPLADLAAILRLRAHFVQQRYTVGHAHMNKCWFLGTIAAWRAGVPIRIYHNQGRAFVIKRKPVRTFRRGARTGIVDAIEDGRTGIVVPSPTDPDMLGGRR